MPASNHRIAPPPRAAAFGFGRLFAHRGGRAHEVLETFGSALGESTLDVGAGSNAVIFRQALGGRYQSLDFSKSYKLETRQQEEALEHRYDLEGRPLPFADGQFETVICLDALEHVDDIHLLYDELFRVAGRSVIISLPNNWPRFLWSFLAGRNITHAAGYGLGPERKRPGERHKFFFNLEEASAFLDGRTPDGFQRPRLAFRFEQGSDGLLASAPGLTHFYRLAGKATPTDARQRYGLAGPPIWFAAKAVYLPARLLDIAVSALFYGWGSPYRFHNLFCRQVWAVFERET